MVYKPYPWNKGLNSILTIKKHRNTLATEFNTVKSAFIMDTQCGGYISRGGNYGY
jgi:hypothetical protein